MFLFLLCVLLPSSLAQYGNSGGASSAQSSSTAQPSATSSASSSVQTVQVGEDGLKFDPQSLVVAPGNTVVFEFYPGNHSVVQSSFEAPCKPANSSSFFSGFIDSSSGPASNVFTLSVNSSDPIWFYCGQISHCQAGMVGVINPPSSGQTLDQYRSAAANSGGSSVQASAQGGSVGPASSATPSGSSSSPSATAKSDGQNSVELTRWGLLLAMVFTLVAF